MTKVKYDGKNYEKLIEALIRASRDEGNSHLRRLWACAELLSYAFPRTRRNG